MAEVVRIEDLIVDELSLVDAPANLRDGWAALKSRGRSHELAVVAKSEPHRIASAVAYEALPAVDGHGEGIDAVTLSVAFLRYAATKNKTLRLQHQPGTAAGEVIALASWPAARKAELCTPSACDSPELTPFTVFSVTRFTPKAFAAVSNGAALGLSLGGSGKRRPGGDTRPAEPPDSGWLWTSDARIKAVAKAADLRRLGDHDIWELPTALDSASLDAIWEATMGLAFLDVGTAAKSSDCRCGGACRAA